MTSIFRLIALIGLALAVSGAAINPGEPIPGVDVNLGKNPGGSVIVVATTDGEGRFSARVRVERGEYVVSTACSPRQTCPPNRQLTLTVDGRSVRPDARGAYLFPVGGSLGTVMLSGRVEIFDRWGRQNQTPR
ncbi:hypothetical protein [Brevundimonas sp.]|uniref:hypothetical protein n=1 Tax=Brevundimonas sp. TaxID=1871086 RepID=UPI002AB9BD8E|nr:hypothetical protein [Brevundimonas sp.]MDZ4109126.1 hypothetical protein [Brevundimonas sp.]HWQ85259.1 hypothetical protein [Brevundimonas sp.]